jgi:type I restriction enzyme, S subunit
MSSEWREVSLESIAELAGGYAFKSEEYTDAGHFVLRTVNITDDGRIDRSGAAFVSPESAKKYERFALKHLDTLFVMVGATLGKTGLVHEPDLPALLNQNMWVVRANPTVVCPLFLHYAFKVLSQPMLGMASGSARGFVKRDDFRQMNLPLPTIPEQIRISSLLGALDDRISLLRDTNATLEAIAQALFKSWFVDFDPVRAKLEGRAPEGMDEATATLFPDSLEESALGLVPRGWRVGTLADLSRLNPESWTAKNHPEFVAYVDLANAKDNEIASVTDFEFDEAPSRARRVLRDGDTIVGTVRPGNRSFAFIHEPASNLTASTGFAVLRPSEVENTEFVYLAATQDSSIEHLAHVADGGAYPAVRPDVVSGLQVVVPDAQVLKAFHAVAISLLAKVSANQKQAQTLATLRDTLLPRLISGQLRLPENSTSGLAA